MSEERVFIYQKEDGGKHRFLDSCLHPQCSVIWIVKARDFREAAQKIKEGKI
jgi:hypothetical protein